jgi:hypothetical protein
MFDEHKDLKVLECGGVSPILIICYIYDWLEWMEAFDNLFPYSTLPSPKR